MSRRGALSPNEVPVLGGVPKRCLCKLVPFCSCWPACPVIFPACLLNGVYETIEQYVENSSTILKIS